LLTMLMTSFMGSAPFSAFHDPLACQHIMS
jgi:hypothetical protein